MAKAAADFLAGRDVTVLRSSPLERALETAEPLAAQFGLTVVVDPRLIEPWNHFEGMTFGVGDGALRQPAHWPRLWNPFRPSWGEPYAEIEARMQAAMSDAADAARGHEAVCVSHQLPIWVARRSVEGRRLWHDPRRRECALASVTSFSLLRRPGDRGELRRTRRSRARAGGRRLTPAQVRPGRAGSGTMGRGTTACRRSLVGTYIVSRPPSFARRAAVGAALAAALALGAGRLRRGSDRAGRRGRQRAAAS